MTDKQMKAAAIRQLRRQGKILPDGATMLIIATTILGKQPDNAPSLVIRNWLAANPPVEGDHRTPATVSVHQPEMKVTPHPRMDEINKAQPPFMTQNGVGNDRQYGALQPDVWGRAK